MVSFEKRQSNNLKILCRSSSRSNLMGTKFTVFDNALNPERALPDMSNARQELAGIIYASPLTAHRLLVVHFRNTV